MKKQENEVTELETLTDEQLKLTAGGGGFDFMGLIQKFAPVVMNAIQGMGQGQGQ